MRNRFRKKFMQFIKQVLVAGVATLLLFAAQTGAGAPPQKPQVEAAWASATVPGQPVGAAYMRITSKEPITLVRTQTPVSSRVQVHTMSTAKGIMKMREVGELKIPASQPVELAPGGMHLMLLGLKKPLKAGETLSITLTFRRADNTEAHVFVNAPIKPMGG